MWFDMLSLAAFSDCEIRCLPIDLNAWRCSNTQILASCLSRDCIGLDDQKRGVKIAVLQIQLSLSRDV